MIVTEVHQKRKETTTTAAAAAVGMLQAGQAMKQANNTEYIYEQLEVVLLQR